MFIFTSIQPWIHSPELAAGMNDPVWIVFESLFFLLDSPFATKQFQC